MKFTIVITSILSITTAVRVPSIWPLSGVNFQNVFSEENRPVRQNGPFTLPNPGYSPNTVNRYSAPNGNKNILSNLPGGNNDWVPVVPPNNGYVQNVANGNSGFGFKEPINNILNPQFGNANGIRKKPYTQQKQGPPRFVQKSTKFTGSPAYNSQKQAFDKSVPEQNQVQYITYTTQLPVAQLHTQDAGFSTIHPVENLDLTQKPGQNQIQYITYTTQLPVAQLNAQEAAYSTIHPVENFNNAQKTLNMKQAYPRVNNPTTAIPLVELDFNPKNPFPRYHQRDTVLDKTLAPQILPLGTRATGNFDFNLNNPFPDTQLGDKPLNGHQISQVPRRPHTHSHSQVPHGLINQKSKVSTKPPLANLDFDPRNPFTKNYRDDRTHEPSVYDPNLDTESVPKVERLESEKAPVTYHEHPAEVPTKPIYPGEGKWAKQGVKHKPFISKHKYTNLDDSEKPDGYDTFLEAQQLFESQQKQFGNKLQEFPQKHQLDASKNTNQRVREDKEEKEEEEEEGGGEPFVPTRLYAQVRHSEDEKHLPAESDENGRLKELIKDSKIQTIYSEEGYEDSAYDHAGHEKNAENVEGLEEDEKKLETKDKKKDPAKQYSHQSTSYSKGDVDLKEEDLDKLKKEELKLEDSESAGTHYEEQSYLNKLKPPKKIFSAKTKGPSKKLMNINNNFVKSKESKTMTTLDKGNGNTEMEISSEVKLVLQPNNSTKSHKYVKIYPKTYKTLQSDDSLKQNKKAGTDKLDSKIDQNNSIVKTNKNTDGIFIEEITNKFKNTTTTFTTEAPTEYPEIFTVEIPTTTQATTAMPKVTLDFPKEDNSEVLKSIDQEFLKTNTNKRTKREANFFPDIQVDTDFIDNINHELGKPKKPKDLTKTKYPYYHSYKEKGLHENSPLRYSESLKNIPVKTEGTLAFYDQANKKMECPEVDPSVDPVPDRVKNAEENEEQEEPSDVAELAKSPRLGQLGDKIDCLKVKYFGENPLDSPFFKEELVGPIKPIFKEIESSMVTKVQNHSKNKKPLDVGVRKSRNTNREDLKIGHEQIPSASGYERENEIQDSFFDKLFGKKFHPSKYFSKTGNGDAIEKIQKFVKKYLDKNDNQESKKKIQLKNENFDNPTNEKQLGFNILSDVVENMRNPKDDAETVKIADKLISAEIPKEVRTQPPATLITTPMYTINLKPKHIYDQIELLEYLPPEENFDIKKETVTDIPKTTSKENLMDFPKMKKTEKIRENFKIPNEKELDPEYEYLPPEKYFDIKKEPVTDIPKTTSKEHLMDFPKMKKTEKKRKNFNINDEKELEIEYGFLPPEKNFDIEKETIADIPKTTSKEHLMDFPKMKIEKIRKNFDIPEKNLEIKMDMPDIKNMEVFKRDFEREAKALQDRNDKIETFGNDRSESPPEADALKRRRRIKPKRPLYQIFDINKYLPKVPKVAYPPTTSKNYVQDFVTNSNFFYATTAPSIQIFDINKYLPTTPFPLFAVAAAAPVSTVLPKYKLISEVFYKDDIKPNEQLNVFNDVLNNIKNSPQAHEDNFLSASHSISVQLPTARTTTVKPTIPSEIQQNLPTNHQMHPREKYFETNKKSKRQRIKTTTQKVAVVEETTPLIEENISSESTDVMGLMPPVSHRYKTIYNPKRDNSLHVSNYPIAEERKLNKYLVPGMKPPPNQKVYLYSDYLTNNHIRSRIGKPKRAKRSANRPAYAEVTRNRKKQQDVTEKVETKKDDDDYVPHRPRNYHYDEKTGKIVYDKKPEAKQEESEEEVEYIEVVEEETPQTTNKPKQNPIFATATPPPAGQSYIDFVNLLKSASNYQAIPDPTTTEKGAEATTVNIVTTTIKPLSTTPPEFLSILAKVRRDDNYKIIEDKKKVKVATTTEAAVEEEVVVVEEEEPQIGNIRNSPGRHSLGEGTNLELFDIVDFLPNIKSYLPKTSIDTSKYKSIERSTLRHNLSSRYSSEEDKDLQNINTSKKPILSNTDETSKAPLTSESKIAGEVKEDTYSSTTTVTPATTTIHATEQPQIPKIRTPSRRRKTTPKSAPTTQEVITTTPSSVTTANSEIPQNDKARRTYRRKSPRIKLRPTTEKNDNTTEIVRRRLERESGVPEPDLVDEDADYEESESRNDEKDNHDIVAPRENYNNTVNVNRLFDLDQSTKKVDIIKDYDKTQKHGGNYKNEYEVLKSNERSQEEQHVIPKLNETADKVREFVAIFNTYDNTKKHGGNYKPENEDRVEMKNQAIIDSKSNETKKIKDVDVFKTYDRTKKHGGNYRSEIEDKAQAITDPQSKGSKKIENIDTFKTYDQTKKHGGNYRSEIEDLLQIKEQAVVGPGTDKPKIIDNVNVFKTYDNAKKHGGNYRPENEDLVQIKEQGVADPETVKPKITENVNIFKIYDNTKKHGGNYRPENEGITDPELKEPKNVDTVVILKAYDPSIKKQTLIDPETKGLKNIEEVNIFKTYDHTKKHGGNYRPENEDIIIKEQAVNDPETKQFKNIDEVDTFKTYDQTKKHGGNYRPENEDTRIKEQQYEESQVVQPKEFLNKYGHVETKRNNDIEVFKKYDKNKKHGGNYQTEDDDVVKKAISEANNSQTEVTSKPNVNKINDVEIFNNYDRNKKHGGNYKRENEGKEQSVEETQFNKIRVSERNQQKDNNKDVQRLADIILKPESFYTDVQLPIAINELNIVNDLSNEDLEEIVASVEEEQLNGEFGNREKNKIEIDHNSIVAEPVREAKVIPTEIDVLTTKKPLFIKDPSKRLYYYAPLR